MAAILKLRRGISATPSLTDGEIFLNYTTGTVQFASGSNGNFVVSNLLPLDKSIDGNINLVGDITASSLRLSGEAVIAGNITFGGSLITLGDESTDNIVISGELSSSIIPNDDNAFDIGSSLKRYKNLYVVSASIDDLSVGGSGILSSSVQNFETFSSSVDSRLDNLNSYTESTDQRLSSIEIFTQSVDSRVGDLEFFSSSEYQTDSSSFDSRLDTLNLYTQSNDQRVNLLEVFTQSADLRLIDLESTSSDQEPRIDNLEASQSFFDNTFSSSVDDRLDSLEIFSESLDAEFLNTNGDNVVSSSIQIDIEQTTNYTTFSSSLYSTDSGLDSRIITLETTFSSSVDDRLDDLESTGSDQESRLDELETTFSSSVDNQLNTIQQYTSSLKNAIEVNGSNLTVIGNLLVQGETTTINTTELLIEDSLLAIASGSTTSDQANGAGFFISGANASFTWNHPNQLLEFNTKLSSSVGFKGDGSELTGVTATNIEYDNIANKPTLVSGSSQIDLTQTTNYVNGIKTRLDVESVFSSSTQVNADSITNFDTNVKDKLNLDDVHSGSYLGTATTSDLDEGSNLYFTPGRFITSSNNEGFFSSSQQVNATFVTNFDTNVKDKLNEDSVISGSSQLTSSFDSLYVNESDFSPFSSSVDSRLDELEGPFSTSVVNRLDLLSDISHSHLNKTELDTINQNLSSSDSPTFSGLSLTTLDELPSGSIIFDAVFISSSNELVYRTLGDSILYSVSQSGEIELVSGAISYDADHLLTAGAVKEYVDWRTEEIIGAIGAADITAVIAGDGLGGGGLTGDVTLTLNTSSAHFIDGVNGVVQLGDGIVSGSDQLTSSFDTRYVNETNFTTFTSSVDTRLVDLENFSSSIDVEYVTQGELAVVTGSLINSINTKLDSSSFNSYTQSTDLRIDSLESFSSSIDTTIKTELNTNDVISGSIGDQLTGSFDTRYLNTNGDNVISGSSQVVYTSLSSIPDGIVSGSTQVDADFITNFDTNVKDKLNTDGVISGSSQVSFNDITDKPTLVSSSDQLTGSLVDLVSDQSIGGTKTFNNIVVNGTGSFSFIQSTTGSSTSIGEAFIVLNENTPSSNFAGIKVVDSGSLFTTASFLYDGQNNQWLFQHEGSEKSGSSLAIFGPLSQDGLGTEVGLTENKIPKAVTDHGHHIGDSNITDTGTLITLGSNSVVTGTFYATGTTLVSGSSQITYSGISSIPPGIVSGSSQVDADSITNFDTNVKAKLDADGVVSQSVQINHDSTTGFVANEHIDHSTVTITAGDGLTGGGNITTSRTINVVGTTNRISVSADAVDISTAYIGQTSITTLGTITTGTWNGSVIGSAFLDADTAHLSGTQTFSGDKTFSSVVNITNSTASTTSTTGALKVTGGVGIGGTLNVGGDVVAFSSSDKRLKDEITPIPNSLQKINSIGGYSFVWNEKQNIYNGKDYGVIAQEIEEILPELVETRENGYKAVKYDRLVSLLIEGIKELTQEVAELKRKLED